MKRRTLIPGIGAAAALLLASAFRPAEDGPQPGDVTYSDVAPILNRHCVECHRPGEVAPFSLIGYDNARRWSQMISIVTQSRRMPPWKADHGFGEFLDENRLSEQQLQILKAWHAAGAPRGDRSKEPAPPKFTSDWPIRKPDLILKPARPFKLEAEGDDVYRNFVLKTDFKETKWVTAMAVRPGNPKVVHHVIGFLDASGRSHELEKGQNDGQEGYVTFGGPGFIPSGSLGGWAPGLRIRETAPGTAFELRPGTTIVMQVHYHKSGKPETDQTQIGLYFADKPVEKPMRLAWIANPMIRILPGQKEQKFSMTYPVPRNITAYAVMPHMHLLGRLMKAEVELPDGSRKPLVRVSDWDFNWQLNYVFKEPIKIPAGSRIRVEAIYDNSSDNPHNPSNPPRLVTWGEETTDEMFLLIAAYTVD
ncbi:MAG TPA: hypothetical protein VM328_13500 [Fimbriimonadaceae bacterium]|nr:hypothetical protein [Fimbriimonadaceae bacterium]